MDDLTPRQVQILKTLIEEYTESAEPVGSDTLEHKYNLGVSPATIRSEMAHLTAAGYLRQPHTSSGRIPTSRALRFYVGQLMQEQKLSMAEEVKARQSVEEAKDDLQGLMHEATRALAQETKTLSVGALKDSNRLWHAGYANILGMPEFYNIDVTTQVLSLLDEVSKLRDLLFRETSDPLEVLFGDEIGWSYFEPVGMVATRFQIGNTQGCLGVIGPARLPFSYIIPRVRYFGNLVAEIGRGR